MLNIAVGTLEENNNSDSKKSLFNFELGTFWNRGKFNLVTTLYLGTFMVYVMFVGVVAMMGERQSLVSSTDVKMGFMIFLFTLPVMVVYMMYIDYITVKQKRTSNSRPKPKK